MTYEENYLAHYGVRGQKWGVRKYQNEDGSLTQLGKEHYGLSSESSPGNVKFSKKYDRELKKMYKKEENANRVTQMQKAITYNSNAKKFRNVGRAALAVAVPAAGVSALAANRSKVYNKIVDINNEAHDRWSFANNNADSARYNATEKNILKEAGRQNRLITIATYDIAKRLPSETQAVGSGVVAGVAGVTAAVAYGASAYNKMQAMASKRRISDKGHAKAVAKRDAQYKKITNMVKDTPYAALFADQIAAYKKEHPNTELSDKQIMKNLM